MKKISETDFSGIRGGFPVPLELSYGGETWETDDGSHTIVHYWKKIPSKSGIRVVRNSEHYKTVGESWDTKATPILHELWSGQSWETIDDEIVKSEIRRAICAGELIRIKPS